MKVIRQARKLLCKVIVIIVVLIIGLRLRSAISRLNHYEYYLRGHAKPRILLMDLKETDLVGEEAGILTTDSLTSVVLSEKRNVLHKVLWFNLPSWVNLLTVNQYMKNCSYSNCEFTAHKRSIKMCSAVIFCITEPGLRGNPPLQSFERASDQVWIFFGHESPATMEQMYNGFIPTWKNSFNWSMSYRLDSDIVVPYGFLRTRHVVPKHNYSEVFRGKTKWAAWVVSNCHPPSLRQKFVDKLKKYGLSVDIYGRCGRRLKTDPLEMISKDYKFYLGFENSMCTDYITEKFFKYYPLNTILVVRGGANYSMLLPPNTYINTADFESFPQLVKFMKKLGSSETLYTHFLKRKDMYSSKIGSLKVSEPFCALCAKINTGRGTKKTYVHVPSYKEQCYIPDDIDKMEVGPKT